MGPPSTQASRVCLETLSWSSTSTISPFVYNASSILEHVFSMKIHSLRDTISTDQGLRIKDTKGTIRSIQIASGGYGIQPPLVFLFYFCFFMVRVHNYYIHHGTHTSWMHYIIGGLPGSLRHAEPNAATTRGFCGATTKVCFPRALEQNSRTRRPDVGACLMFKIAQAEITWLGQTSNRIQRWHIYCETVPILARKNDAIIVLGFRPDRPLFNKPGTSWMRGLFLRPPKGHDG